MCVLAHTVLELHVKVLKTLYFAGRLQWLSQWRYWSLLVGFLYTEVINVLSGPGETKVSMKGMNLLLLGTSVVNCMCGSMELMCCKNCWLCSAYWMTKVSFTYLCQRLGGLVAVLMALDSNCSINRLAMMGLMGEHMASPWTYA